MGEGRRATVGCEIESSRDPISLRRRDGVWPRLQKRTALFRTDIPINRRDVGQAARSDQQDGPGAKGCPDVILQMIPDTAQLKHREGHCRGLMGSGPSWGTSP